MTTRHLIWIFAIAAAVLAAPVSFGQNEPPYCAFEVAVKSPAGTPVAGIGVALTQDEKIYDTAITDARGIAQICDAPKGLVDIEAGGHLCGAVSVRYLKSYWMETRRVSVTYENCSGDDFFPYGGCLFTIRVYDEKHTPLAGVIFQGSSKDAHTLRPQTSISDRFGRIFRFVAYRQALNGRFEKADYSPKSIVEECKPGGQVERDRVIILTPTAEAPTVREPTR